MSMLEKRKITGLGARLKKTRENMRLTEKEAAARLYLNPKIIEVIESEAFFEGPPITFMKGYLRSYARMLEIPESEINHTIEELEIASMPATSLKPAMQPNPAYQSDRYIHWLSYLISFALIALVFLWWQSHNTYVTTTDAKPSSESVTPTEIQSTVENAPLPTDTTSPPANDAVVVTAPMIENSLTPDPVTTAPVTAPEKIEEPTSPAIATTTTEKPAQSVPESTTVLPTPPVTPANLGTDTQEITAALEKPPTPPREAVAEKPKHEKTNPIDIMALPEPE